MWSIILFISVVNKKAKSIVLLHPSQIKNFISLFRMLLLSVKIYNNPMIELVKVERTLFYIFLQLSRITIATFRHWLCSNNSDTQNFLEYIITYFLIFLKLKRQHKSSPATIQFLQLSICCPKALKKIQMTCNFLIFLIYLHQLVSKFIHDQ